MPSRGRKTPLRLNPLRNPGGAAAQCDRCSCWVEHGSLREQTEYRGGTAPVGNGVMVCGRCLDRPNPQGSLNTQVLKQDPEPVLKARPDTTTYDLTILSYALAALPPAIDQFPGHQVYVTDIDPDPVLAYADGQYWFGYYTGERIAGP